MADTKSIKIKEKQSYGTIETSDGYIDSYSVRTSFRWIVYLMCSYQTFCCWFIMYTPTGLEAQFIDEYNLTYGEYALLFSMATGPTCIFPLIAGVIVDKFGMILSALTSISILLVGNILFACSLYASQPLVLMYIARCFTGIGICYYSVINNAILYPYFYNAELAFALSISPIHSRTGLAAGEFISYYLYQYMSLQDVIWFTAVLCAFGLLFQATVLLQPTNKLKNIKNVNNNSTYASICSSFRGFSFGFWVVVALAGIGYLPFLCWMITGTDALMTTYGYSQSYSNSLLLIPNLSALLGCFAVGMLIDRFGKIQIYFLLSGSIFTLWHVFFLYGNDLFTKDTDETVIIIMLSIFGIGFSCFSTSIWTSIAILSGHQKIGTGNGCAFFSYAIFYAVGQFIVGELTDIGENVGVKYYYVSIFLLFISIGIIIGGIVLVIDDCKNRSFKLWKIHKGAENKNSLMDMYDI